MKAEAVLLENRGAEQPVAYPIPQDWRAHPELIPVLRTLVEGAKRALLAQRIPRPGSASED